MLLWIIVACEVGFWLLLGAGMAVRYLLRMPRLSTVLLVSVPLIDVVLLIASVVDMRAGTVASLRHGLAAAYIGYSVMFGHQTIKWVDERVAHRFAGGPPPTRPAKGGWPRLRHEIVIWVRIVLAYGVAWVVAGLLIVVVGDPAKTDPLWWFMIDLGRIPLIALLWPVSWSFSVGRGSGEEEDGDEARATPAGSGSAPAGRS